jgi:prepilin-type N-terminal cleavage/methylation domain-containing protein
VTRRTRGFTLIEVVLALVIVTVLAVSIGRFTAMSVRSAGWAQVRTSATAVAKEQLERVREHPDYTTLVATYNLQTQTGFPGYPNMSRVTRVTRVTATTPIPSDVTTITVRVTDPRLTTPVNLSIVRAP